MTIKTALKKGITYTNIGLLLLAIGLFSLALELGKKGIIEGGTYYLVLVGSGVVSLFTAIWLANELVRKK